MKSTLTRTPIKSTPQPIRKSHWGGDRGRVRPKLLPLQFGDGKNDVIVSFYHAPEIEILVRFDSARIERHQLACRGGIRGGLHSGARARVRCVKSVAAQWRQDNRRGSIPTTI